VLQRHSLKTKTKRSLYKKKEDRGRSLSSKSEKRAFYGLRFFRRKCDERSLTILGSQPNT